MSKNTILITGANGEMGHGLITNLGQNSNNNIIAIDLNTIDHSISKYCHKKKIGDITNNNIINSLHDEYQFDSIFHLAALLSTKAEKHPIKAHNVNVGGTINLLELAKKQIKTNKKQIKFFFPSSIAVYGLKNIEEKRKANKIKEENFLNPITIYGCNKLYCEHLGKYYSNSTKLDFRAIRFPGIISSKTVPNAGTSDYIPEMLHAAAKGEKYSCFVRKDTQIPFMTMPDAISGIIKIMMTEKSNLKHDVYNIRSFAPTVEEFKEKILEYFPNTNINFTVDKKRQKMVDGWPMDTNDDAAKNEWGWKPFYNLNNGLSEYLIPDLKKKYL